MYLTRGFSSRARDSGRLPLIHPGKGTAMGSLGVFAEGSSEFALDSGSVLLDALTGAPSFILRMLSFIGFGTSLDLTASVADGPY